MKKISQLSSVLLFMMIISVSVSANSLKDIFPEYDIRAVYYQVNNIGYINENGMFHTKNSMKHCTENKYSISYIMDLLDGFELVECEKGNPVSDTWSAYIEITGASSSLIITGGTNAFYNSNTKQYFSKNVLYINDAVYEVSLDTILDISRKINELRSNELNGSIIYKTGMPQEYNYRLRLNELGIVGLRYSSKSSGQGIPVVKTPESERNNMNVSFDAPEAIKLFVGNTDYIPLKLLGETEIVNGGDLGYKIFTFTTADGNTEKIEFYEDNSNVFNYRGKSYEIEEAFKEQFMNAVELAYEVENSNDNVAEKTEAQTKFSETNTIDYLGDVVKAIYILITNLITN